MEVTLGASESEPPKVTALFPLNKSVGINTNATFNISFSKSVKIGNGNLLVRKTDDREIALVIPANRLSITGNMATFQIENLKLSTTYDIEIPEGYVTDIAGNPFSGIKNKDVWSFTTNEWPIYQYSFQDCSVGLTGMWAMVNVKGDSA
ncbi:MAG: Ig-like domain-containing protein, partial [Bacteroidota bacterium]